MTKKELLEILKELGWTQVELAKRVKKTPVSVCRWETVPGGVEAYLRLYVKAKEATEEMKWKLLT